MADEIKKPKRAKLVETPEYMIPESSFQPMEYTPLGSFADAQPKGSSVEIGKGAKGRYWAQITYANGKKAELLVALQGFNDLINTDLEGVTDPVKRENIVFGHFQNAEVRQYVADDGKAFYRFSKSITVDRPTRTAAELSKSVKGLKLSESMSRAI